MKQYILIFAFILVSVMLTGQDSLRTDTLPTGRTFHVYRDVGIAFAPTYRYSASEGASVAGTFKMRMFLGKRFSFDSEITAGKDYLTFGLGLLGIPCWLALSSPGEGEQSGDQLVLLAAVFAALTAEHVAYHIPLKKYTDLSPYISLLKFQTYYGSYKDAHPDTYGEQVCFALGIELNKYFNKVVLSPYVEYNQGYGNPHGFMYAGVYLGFYIFN
jgi:hypothetical protein